MHIQYQTVTLEGIKKTADIMYGISSTVEMNYLDPRRAEADATTSREPINIAQSEYDFLQDFIQAALDGYFDDEDQPEVFSSNIMGKNIYYSIISW